MARSLERVWEEKLRAAEAIEQDYERWRHDEPLVLSTDRQALQKLGEDLPGIWHSPSTTAAERKGILRLIVCEVILDQKRFQGQVWFKILWQTGATSEHSLQRQVHTYSDYIDLERLRSRVIELNVAGEMDKEIAATLNAEGFVAARGHAFKGENVWLLRTRWGTPLSRSTGRAPIPTAGQMEPTLFKGRPPPWTSHNKPSSTTSPAAGSRDASSRRGSRGKRTLGQPDQHAASADRTYQAIKEEGIMKTSLIP
ncbi:hypothetical protein [Mesorhizobium sp. M0217]|uniref:hypothetical protein n=1 Tax=unclassified Mesorhizobium TaxID=325217 RepID=UPI003335596F